MQEEGSGNKWTGVKGENKKQTGRERRGDQTQIDSHRPSKLFIQFVLLQTDKKRWTLKMIWRCFICYVFVALTLKKLLSHVNNVHSRSPDFRVVCGIDGCSSEYRVYNSYYYHVKPVVSNLFKPKSPFFPQLQAKSYQ